MNGVKKSDCGEAQEEPQTGEGGNHPPRFGMDYFGIISEKIGKEEAQKKVDAKIESFHGLLTKEAAAKLIASELGLIERSTMKISELKEGLAAVDVVGKIKEIGPMRTFPSGASLRNIIIADSSGEVAINFWAQDAKKTAGMHLGDTLEVQKGYVKMGKVNVGYKSTYKIVENAKILETSEVGGEAEGLLVVGKVDSIEGKKGNAFVFTISDGKKRIPVSLLNSPGKGEHLQVGDSVLLEGVNYNGAELMVEGRARMLLKKNRKNIFRGKLEKIELEGEVGRLFIGGEEFLISTHALIKFLNLRELREDIDLQVVLGLKVPELVGRDVFLKFGDKEGNKEVEYAELR